LELADYAFGLPYDWGMCQRMMEAGVRMGMLDDTTVDYFPSRSWTPRWSSESDRQLPAANGEGQHAADDPPLLTVPQPAELPKPETASEATEAPANLPEWEYVSEGWERARDPAAASAVGWSAADVARAYREKWPRFLQAVQGPGPLGVSHEVPVGAPISRTDVFAQDAVLAYAFALARAAHGTGKVSILDWGGALGHHYVLGRRLLPEVSLDYHCRELPEVCAEGQALLPDITFHDTDACLARRYDLVIASGSLQYVSDWRGLLERLAKASGSWTFVTRVPVAGHASFVVLQRAYAYGYATEYLGWVFDPTELLGAARTADLELDREFVILPEMVVPGAPAAVAHAGFLFRTTRRSR
ncbi:MAG: methyltransferase, TIGR04325 family, partial [Solirubrobacteraceae bacterium]